VTVRLGDRVAVDKTNGPVPVRRYGNVTSVMTGASLATVEFDEDGELLPVEVIDLRELAPVTVESLFLSLDDASLLTDAVLRTALTDMWVAEAERAHLPVAAVHRMATTMYDGEGTWLLAEVVARGTSYVLQAGLDDRGLVGIFCRRQNRYDF
jgi:hypothetical protein